MAFERSLKLLIKPRVARCKQDFASSKFMPPMATCFTSSSLPLTNNRKDEYGGSFENRTRIGREVVSAIRKQWPENLPALYSNFGNRLERRRLGRGAIRRTGEATQATGRGSDRLFIGGDSSEINRSSQAPVFRFPSLNGFAAMLAS